MRNQSTLTQKTFILGVGMAKAGTTWLYEYLASHPQVRMGFEKEMHILHAPEYRSYWQSVRNIPWRKFEGRQWLKRQLVRAKYRANWSRYFNYFESLLCEGALATGDLSPSNQFAPISNLLRVRVEFERRKIDVVPVFIARDPVERMLSEIRYGRRLIQNSRYRTFPPGSDEDHLLSRISQVSSSMASEAPDAVHRIVSVFGSSRTCVLLYEDMFNDEALGSMTSKMGIRHVAANFSRRVNSTQATGSISPASRKHATNYFRITYEWAMTFFGRERIMELWPNAHILFNADD